MHKSDGYALPMTIIITAVVAIFSTVLFFLSNTDLQQATINDQRMECYHLARSAAAGAINYIRYENPNIESGEYQVTNFEDEEHEKFYTIVLDIDNHGGGHVDIISTAERDNISYSLEVELDPRGDVTWKEGD